LVFNYEAHKATVYEFKNSAGDTSAIVEHCANNATAELPVKILTLPFDSAIPISYKVFTDILTIGGQFLPFDPHFHRACA